MSHLLRRLTRRKTKFEHEEGHALKRVLGVRDLTSMGVAAIIGAGIFSTVGAACYNGGPGVVILFIITAIASAFSAICYAEFASRIPVAGSAYTYAYATFGEFAAWIIGWALILEYSIGNIAVAQSWSGYFSTMLNALLANWDLEFPAWLSVNYPTAKEAFLALGNNIDHSAQAVIPRISDNPAAMAWYSAPELAGFKLILDLPAIAVTIFITWLVYRGVKETRNVGNAMVALKLFIILLVIGVGAFYIEPANWKPVFPNGFGGVISGISAVFFAYIGFDAISTTAEECKNPARDLPRGMFYSLLICTVLYILITLVLTGMTHYSTLKVMDPLAFIFESRGMNRLGGFISATAVVALTGVLLVFQLGQPRIWLSMSRDGLLPKSFSKVHPKYRTPSFATIITGFVVGIPLLFFTTGFSVDFTSIGTLFAFLLVCAGTLLLKQREEESGENVKRKYKMPSWKGTWVIPIAFILTIGLLGFYHFDFAGFFQLSKWQNLQNALLYLFLFEFAILSVFTFLKKWNFISIAGVLMCSYLLTGMNGTSWKWFFVWFAIGIAIYFSFSYKNSKLAKA
ncbi:MAG: amino acid permease [Bacteroidetes bacterium]|nr:amino acid permease [Bacteroidota bacterium]